MFQLLKKTNTVQYVQYKTGLWLGCSVSEIPGDHGSPNIGVHTTHAQGIRLIVHMNCPSLVYKLK